ncbi:expressed unknown protein [Seminavis robusta]|uniref:Transmembrane protein n=1 Tax=Seminavis robusta TaxID=568900 RepID=A0A9N8EAJ6_9STRA|nr:expressed unknown protein [Seminavis robusta]|eukprot:Sro887_g216350.1 n/a (172) ;mRNA; f:35681-36196
MSSNNNTTAISTGAPVDNLKKQEVKQGHSFLGCLCDMRRAVIILDTLGFFGSIIGLLVVILYDKYGTEDDKQLLMLENYDFGAFVAIYSAVIIAHFSGIMGALTFTICPILITILMNIAYAVLSGLSKNWIGLGVYIFLLYPHVFLCHELAKGIMTKENYRSQERQSCCCV